jgi:hypothetical protein
MEAHCKVISLKTAMTAAYDVLSNEYDGGPTYGWQGRGKPHQ